MSVKKTFYIGKNTRIRYRYTASLFGYGHVLERRKSWWIFHWWVETASTYDDVVPVRGDIVPLVEVLFDLEKHNEAELKRKNDVFSGYPTVLTNYNNEH